MNTLTIQSESETITLAVRETVVGLLTADGARWPSKAEQLRAEYDTVRRTVQARKAAR